MSQIFATFGVDWRLLLINVLNFGVLLIVLWYFLYSPLMRILRERQAKVAQGVKDAQEATKRLSEIEGSKERVLSEAGAEADALLERARAAALSRGKELMAQSEAAAAATVRDAEQEAREIKARALKESKEEIAKLVVLGMEKALQK